MDIRQHLDALLAHAAELGRVPQRFVVREEDWGELASRYHLDPDPKTEGVMQYCGVLVEFGQVSQRMIAALYDTNGEALLEEWQ
jgi:hypothetical protein